MNKQKNIVIVDDEIDILEILKINIERNNYKAYCFQDGESAISHILKNLPDLIILDLMLPGIDGFDICRLLKNKDLTKNIPILILSAKGEESDIIKGLELGADDYVTKPFSAKVLSARVNTLLRRSLVNQEEAKDKSITFEELSIHPGKRNVKISNKTVDLTYTEFQILFLLASHPNWVYTRNQIIDEIRGDDYPVTDRSIDFQIVGLRKKLQSASRFIKTVRGVGYRFLIED
tara:strand:+ start:1507 stop:2205 length:699 start_codon:yes stop_codon:yes gene_type:complete